MILAVSLKVFVITKWHLVTLHKMYELGSAQGVLMDQGTAVFDWRTWKRFVLACFFLFLSRTSNRAFSCVSCNMFNSVHLTRSITSDLRSCGAHHKTRRWKWSYSELLQMRYAISNWLYMKFPPTNNTMNIKIMYRWFLLMLPWWTILESFIWHKTSYLACL